MSLTKTHQIKIKSLMINGLSNLAEITKSCGLPKEAQKEVAAYVEMYSVDSRVLEQQELAVLTKEAEKAKAKALKEFATDLAAEKAKIRTKYSAMRSKSKEPKKDSKK